MESVRSVEENNEVEHLSKELLKLGLFKLEIKSKNIAYDETYWNSYLNNTYKKWNCLITIPFFNKFILLCLFQLIS